MASLFLSPVINLSPVSFSPLIIKMFGGNMPLFLIYCVFCCCTWYRNRRNTLLMHGCCRLEATGSRVEAGLQGDRCGYTWVLRSKSVEDLPSVPTGTRTYAPHIRGSNGPVSECPPA
jgi:hypothetical protein